MQPHETYAVLDRYGHTGVSLAEALGVNQATVSRWVTRGVPLDQLARVCAVLGCTPAELRPECVEVDGIWLAPASAIRAEASPTRHQCRLVRWAEALALLDGLGVPLDWVPVDRLAG